MGNRAGGLRIAATALVSALIATLLSIVEAPGEGAVAARNDRFPLAVRPDLTHASHDLTVTVGTETASLDDGSARIDGSRGVSGLVQATDAAGHLAGAAIAPKDDVALLGLRGEGPLDIPVTYESTAFSLFALQPGVATTEPSITVLIAALVMDLPEMDSLTDAVATAAEQDPAYLVNLSPEIDARLQDLLAAFDRRVTEADAALEVERGSPPTTQLFVPPRVSFQADPDGCDVERNLDLRPIDLEAKDGVCIADAEFNGSTWEVSGTSSTPRWAVARAVNHGVPADGIQLVPGRALSLPSLEQLASDLGESFLLGQFDTALNAGINVCNAGAWLIGKRCGDPDRPGVIERFVDKVEGYFAEAEFSFDLSGAEAQTVLGVNGLGNQGTRPSNSDLTTSWVTTIVMTVVVPAIGIIIDIQEIVVRQDQPFNTELLIALVDTAATVTPAVTRFVEEAQTGSLLDRLGEVVDLGKEIIRATIDSGLLVVLVNQYFDNARQDVVGSIVRELGDKFATLAVKWIDLGLDAINALATLGMLIDDYPELHRSARYGLGFAEAPEDPAAFTGDASVPIPSEPLGNPALPAESCGLRVSVVLDVSSSISMSGGTEQVRDAASGLVDAFGETATSMRISTFAGSPRTRLGWTTLGTADGRRNASQAAAGIDFDQGTGADSGTNWEAALFDVLGDDADLVVFVTDGNPNQLGSGIESRSNAGTTEFDPNALAAGVDAANILKANGTRIVAVGVGDANLDPLRQVSGPVEGQDYFLGDFDALALSLSTVADELCGGALILDHLVDGTPAADAVYTVDVFGEDPVDVTTAADGKARIEYRPPPDEVATTIVIRWPAGPLEDLTCEQGGTPLASVRRNDDARTATLVVAGVVTCKFEWRGFTGSDSVLAEVLNGPGDVTVASLEPNADMRGIVTGCFGPPGADAASCDRGAFGVSFAEGFAILRYDAACDGCEPVDSVSVTPDENSVRFVLDLGSASSGPAITASTAELDVTVDASRATSTRPQPSLRGTVGSNLPMDVDYWRGVPFVDACLFSRTASNWSLVQDNTVRVGAGC